MEDELVVVDSKIKPNINICSDIINLDTLLSNKLLLRPEGSELGICLKVDLRIRI